MNYPDTSYENKFWSADRLVAGIDEAGRGALAGPVVAAAVILPIGFDDSFGINDSKLIKENIRYKLYDSIIEKVISFGIGIVDNEIIEEINILQATFRAMNMAVAALNPVPAHLLIDGNRFSGSDIEYTTIVDGDAKCLSIAAASIIAKVTRDRIMTDKYDELYPEFCFSEHKGYGTKKHMNAIDKFGLSPIHRRSFLKKHFEKKLIQELEF